MKDFSNLYSRFTNPTVDVFEKRIAALEGGVAAVATSSGTSAIMIAILAVAQSGENIVTTSSIYSGSHHQLKGFMSRLGVHTRFVNGNRPEDFVKMIDDKTRCLYVESIGNPTGNVPDLERLADVAHAANVPLIVDNTFGAGGYFCRPFDHNVDLIVHSATKWIGGHGTALGGVIVDSGRFNWSTHAARYAGISDMHRRFGPLGFTLHCKYERSDKQAKWLQRHRSVAWVSYPGLKNHPSYTLATKYLPRGFGAVLTFGVKGGEWASRAVVDRLEVVTNTANLGDSKSLALHLYSTSYKHFSAADMASTGVTQDMIRFSVGIENIEDIFEDFEQAFTSVEIEGVVSKRSGLRTALPEGAREEHAVAVS